VTRVLTCLLALLAALLFLLLPPAAQAHEGRPVYIEVQADAAGNTSLRWKIPPVMRTADLPLILLSGGGCAPAADTPVANAPALIGRRTYRCPQPPETVDLRYPASNPALSALVLYRRADGSSSHIMVPPDQRIIPLPRPAGLWAVARGYATAGVDHILEGYDHLLFVLCLMLLARTLRATIVTVTGFTLGHSLTLGAASLGHLSLPPTLVEPLIAFSILLLAAEAARGRTDTLASRHTALVAAAFGLLHGLGFAGALREIGLPEGHQIPALLFFNIGVEAGQVLFVAVAFSAYALLRRLPTRAAPTAATQRALVLYPAGAIAAFWTIERVTGALA
jgi:hypothetical protein